MDKDDTQEKTNKVIVRCDCGLEIKVEVGSDTFYCSYCEAAKVIGSGLGFILPKG